ncbi:tyrosine-type recombinase/integrase [Planctomicrobium sp. SH664]|uniref:tyrosine-type recombinase/integrase n=1 Tax=Planctomicrobium sp. SH664 TaxID=3448125 RepID=UPI003F5AEC91
MAKQRSTRTIQCQYFTWKIFKRGSVFYTDGRSGTRNLGKHSLNAKTEEDAYQNLQRLDQAKAREVGLIEEAMVAVPAQAPEPITIEEGREKFLEHSNRPPGLGGVSRNTNKKYMSVKDKHIAFCENLGIRTWQDFNKKQAENYGRWLEKNNYAPRTFYFELMLLVSIVKWLIGEYLLDAKFRFHLKLAKPEETETYCDEFAEVQRMLERCQTTMAGRWIRPILTTLACTGVRIGELISLRWEDIGFAAKAIHVVDNRLSNHKQKARTVRTTKGKRSRLVPLATKLEEVLRGLARHPDGFVFRGAKGGKLRDRKVLAIFIRAIRNPLKKEFPVPVGEIGFQNGTIHSSRHYFVSKSFRKGGHRGRSHGLGRPQGFGNGRSLPAPATRRQPVADAIDQFRLRRQSVVSIFTEPEVPRESRQRENQRQIERVWSQCFPTH